MKLKRLLAGVRSMLIIPSVAMSGAIATSEEYNEFEETFRLEASQSYS